MLSEAKAAVQRAIAFLERRQLADGSFPHFVWQEPDVDGRTSDPSVFPNALIAQALASVDQAKQVQDRALDFLATQCDRRGLWRHPARGNRRNHRMPPDLDDTCCASQSLLAAGRRFPDNRTAILARRDRRGLFRTWAVTPERWLLRPLSTYLFFTRTGSRLGDVDAVVNANVLYCLGDMAETRPVIDYLLEQLHANKERVCDKWYDNPFAVWYFFSRALAGCGGEAGDPIERRVRAAAPAHALDLAFGATSLLRWHRKVDERTIAALLHAQLASGGWPITAVYKGGPRRWGSEELVTAFCVEALAGWSADLGQ